MDPISDPHVAGWLARRTIGPVDHPVSELLEAKRASGSRIAVCLPALDEANTIGDICRVVDLELVATGLVDELIVMDSGSSDATSALAEAAGARVYRSADVLAEAGAPAAPGKGESLWKSLAVIDSDIVVWVDSDTRNFRGHFVTRLLGPLLDDDSVKFTKAFYERPLAGDPGARSGGGRVTEIAIRPLINLLVPHLAGFAQPLSGEYAGRADVLRELPFSVGYDVDLLLLMDVVQACSLEAVAQIDLGKRVHRNRDTASLGRMSFEIARGLLARLEAAGSLKLGDDLPVELLQFTAEAPATPKVSVAANEQRPPMARFT